MVTPHRSMQNAVTLANWWQVTWESDSRRPRHSRALDDEELFVVEGSQPITSGDCAQRKILQNKGYVEIMPRFPRKIVRRSKNCAHFSILREGNRLEHSARFVNTSKTQYKSSHCRGRRRAWPFPHQEKSRTRIDLRSRVYPLT